MFIYLCYREQSCQVLLDTHIFIKNFNGLVRYYLTRMLFVKSFNRLVRYYLTRLILIIRMLFHSG